ncbi:energy-coupling factor ABC transporter permease [Gynuella sp.]|uniref:energy-coupling factor ABC transporter permease n=1 Tax=Gynuella sp. TaxID=2969146 RepID=UPI003D13A6C8
MNITADLFSPIWYWSFDIAFALLLLMATNFLEWHELRGDKELQHRFGLSLVILVLIWSMRAGISTGLGIHFFLVTTLHLVFGWQLAMYAVALAILGMVWIGKESWQGIGINGFVSGVVPILCTYTLWRIQRKSRLNSPFAFIFLVAFLGAIISVVASGVLMTAIFLGAGVYDFDHIVSQFWIYVPLIALPEAILNGTFITGMIVFRPEWVKLFDQKKYFN